MAKHTQQQHIPLTRVTGIHPTRYQIKTSSHLVFEQLLHRSLTQSRHTIARREVCFHVGQPESLQKPRNCFVKTEAVHEKEIVPHSYSVRAGNIFENKRDVLLALKLLHSDNHQFSTGALLVHVLAITKQHKPARFSKTV